MAAGLWTASGAAAGVKLKIDEKTYSITGKTGEALLAAMDRRGPKHGLLTRAIAQTKYSVDWTIEWSKNDGVCKVANAEAKLRITYTYPKVDGAVSKALTRQWKRFMGGVRKHEEMHGAIAREMVTKAQRAVAGLSLRGDPTCRKSRMEVKRRVNALYAQYEKKQITFDAREHKEGGHVDGLVGALRRVR
jgi:predicted secreted Zn-dependent protease